MKRILVICTGNSCRSQMAEGILNYFGKGVVQAFSAGTHPCYVNPFAIGVMREIGIDITPHRSKSIDEFRSENFDYVITVCDSAKEECPVFPGQHIRIHMPFEDPVGFVGTRDERMNKFREVRATIEKEMRGFLESIRKAAL